MRAYWVRLENNQAGCIDAEDDKEADFVAMIVAAMTKTEVKSVEILPYPANPYWVRRSDMPTFCIDPNNCAGRTSCPKHYACSE